MHRRAAYFLSQSPPLANYLSYCPRVFSKTPGALACSQQSMTCSYTAKVLLRVSVWLRRLGMVVANGTFVNVSIIASGVGNVYVIGVEDQVAVNLAGTAAVSIGADSSKLLDSSEVVQEPSTVHSRPSVNRSARVHSRPPVRRWPGRVPATLKGPCMREKHVKQG